MDKKQKHPFIPQSELTNDNGISREQQAQEIMQQLVAEGIFAPDEPAEIIFSDSAFICTPDTKQKPAGKKGMK